jgi:cell division protein FtsW
MTHARHKQPTGDASPGFGPMVDGPAFLAVLVLVSLGIIMVASSSSTLAMKTFGDASYYLKRQIVFALVGMVGMVGASSIPWRFWEKNAYRLLGLAFVLLVLVLIPGIGHSAGGARRWIQLGPIGVQAGEVMKLALVVWLSLSLAKKRGDAMKTFSIGLLPHLMVPGMAVLLLMGEPDFGTSVMLLFVTFLMLFVAGARIGYLFWAGVAALPFAIHAIASSEYRMRRVLAFLDPWTHRSDVGYQITESLMTLGSGGFWGLGLGESKQKLFFLPAAHTDFIFAVLGEELGFLGVMVVVLCFFTLVWRGVRAAVSLNQAFPSYLTIALAWMIVVQAIFNMSVVLGLVPTKGITLPFVSAGGSSLMSTMFMTGVLLRLIAEGQSRRALKPAASSATRATRASS